MYSLREKFLRALGHENINTFFVRETHGAQNDERVCFTCETCAHEMINTFCFSCLLSISNKLALNVKCVCIIPYSGNFRWWKFLRFLFSWTELSHKNILTMNFFPMETNLIDNISEMLLLLQAEIGKYASHQTGILSYFSPEIIIQFLLLPTLTANAAALGWFQYFFPG